MTRALLVALLAGACGGSSAKVDAGSDVPGGDPCDACTGNQICIQRFDGTCNVTTTCIISSERCPDNACTASCEAAYCPRPFQCSNRVPCGGESPQAFTCYGP